jgi:hypothetical protein
MVQGQLALQLIFTGEPVGISKNQEAFGNI